MLQNDVIKCCKMMSPHSNESAMWRNCVSRRQFCNIHRRTYNHFPKYHMTLFTNKKSDNRPINNLARVRDLRFACSIPLWEILIFLCFILEISQKSELLFYSLLPFISVLHFSMKIVFRDNLLLQKITIFLQIFM